MTTFEELEIGDLVKVISCNGRSYYRGLTWEVIWTKEKKVLLRDVETHDMRLEIKDSDSWELIKKREPEVKADRKNSGKPRPTQIDWDFVNDIMLHMHKSEVKYPDKNGRPNYWSDFDSVIQDAHNSLMRHALDLARGILVDKESGTDTVICIATNCMIINKHKEQYAAECAKFFDRKDKA